MLQLYDRESVTSFKLYFSVWICHHVSVEYLPMDVFSYITTGEDRRANNVLKNTNISIEHFSHMIGESLSRTAHLMFLPKVS